MPENNPSPEPSLSPNGNEPESKPKGNRGLLYVILIVALAGTWGYLLWDKSQHNQKESQLLVQVASTDSSRASLQRDFDAANAQIDELSSENTHMDSLVKSKDQELSSLRGRITQILGDKNATQAQLNQARDLIAQLNGNIEQYKQEVERLEGEKIVLTTQRDSIKRSLDTATQVNSELSQKVDLGSVLHASNIQIRAVHLRPNGKEVITNRAKRADRLQITFDLDENRITPSGPKDLYVCITAPDGTPLAVEALGSGRFTLADGTEKLYTAMKSIPYTTGKKSSVNIQWKQNSTFSPGTYKVEIYQGGYLIGQGDVLMKKGGFL